VSSNGRVVSWGQSYVYATVGSSGEPPIFGAAATYLGTLNRKPRRLVASRSDRADVGTRDDRGHKIPTVLEAVSLSLILRATHATAGEHAGNGGTRERLFHAHAPAVPVGGRVLVRRNSGILPTLTLHLPFSERIGRLSGRRELFGTATPVAVAQPAPSKALLALA
jgi:hypothetical protein